MPRATMALYWTGQPTNSTLPGPWAHTWGVLPLGVEENRSEEDSDLAKTQALGFQTCCGPLSPRPRKACAQNCWALPGSPCKTNLIPHVVAQP